MDRTPQVSVLVAFRESGDGERTRLWEWIRARLEAEHPDFEIVLGTDDGVDPFHKTLADNRAARGASGDVFYIADSDTWVTPSRLRAAVAGAATDRASWWRPWTEKLRVGERVTAELLARPEWDGSLDRLWWKTRENRNSHWAAPPLVLSREAFEAAGGYDERFRGWGHEDDAFAHVLRGLFGESVSIRGTAIHLFHPRIGRSGSDLWPGQTSREDNRALALRYRDAERSPAKLRALLESRGGRGA